MRTGAVSFAEYRHLLMADLYRIEGRSGIGPFLKQMFLVRWYDKCYRYNFWMRTCQFVHSHAFTKYTLYPFVRMVLHHYAYKFGIHIHFMANIGPGFFIGHYSGLFLHPDCKIGRNCNISQGVSIGFSNSRKRPGCPSIGDNVYIGPGAKIFGGISIGDNAAIGANCVVTKDVPRNSVVVGVPGRIISEAGSAHYIKRIDY